MVILALDFAVIAIVLFCGWRGYKNGLIRGVFGAVSLIVSLFIASVAATAYSEEFTEVLNPFVSGLVDSAIVKVIEQGVTDQPDDYKDISDSFKTAYTALRRIGLPEAAAIRVADLATKDIEEDGLPTGLLSNSIGDRLSSVLAFVAVFGIAFILLAIVFTVVGNLVGFVFSLPGLRLLDMISGVVFGLIKGLIIVFALAAVIRYVGILAPETLDGTSVLKHIVNNNPIANRIGV